MSTAKMSIKNIDYYKYRKLVIDGNRDDYALCSREVRCLCDAVQTLTFRDDEFDESSDRARFDDVSACYRQILASKRIDPVDMRLKSGWWGEAGRAGSAYSAGKIKSTMLLDVLMSKARDWAARHHDSSLSDCRLECTGLYVFKHRERQCFQQVGRADNVFLRCSELLKSAFEGTASDPLSALLVISLASDWDFYCVPVETTDGDRLERILENDLILKHDSIWPHGLNFSLHIESLIEVTEFRRSCLRHRWPPEYDSATREQPELDLDLVRRSLASSTDNRKSPNDGSTPVKKNAAVVNTDARNQSSRHWQKTSAPATADKHLVTKTTTSDVTDDDRRPSTVSDSGHQCVKTTSQSPSKLNYSKQKTTTTATATTTTSRACTAISTSTTTTTSTTLASDAACSDDTQAHDVSAPAAGTLQRSSTYTSLQVTGDHTLPDATQH